MYKKVFTKPKICFTIEVDIKQGKERMKPTIQAKCYIAGYKDGFWKGYQYAIRKLIEGNDADLMAIENTKHLTDFKLRKKDNA